MNYYNLEILNKKIKSALFNNDEQEYFKLYPLRYFQYQTSREVELRFSRKKTYISEKELFFNLIDFKDKLDDLGCKFDVSKINIEDALLTEEIMKKEEHYVDYKGSIRKGDLDKLQKKAFKEIKMNPFYFYFKNLNELSDNKEKCISIDFEFSPIHGPTEMGATYHENGKLVTKWYRVKGTPDRKKPSNYNEKAEMVDMEDLKELMKLYYKKFDTFIFHDYTAEKKIIERMFKGNKGTPFDGIKKIVDTQRAAQYIRQRDKKFSNSGFNDTLKGLCGSMNVQAEGFHNAANDTRFTFNVARKLSNKYRKLWEKYVDRDLNNPIKRDKKIKLN